MERQPQADVLLVQVVAMEGGFMLLRHQSLTLVVVPLAVVLLEVLRIVPQYIRLANIVKGQGYAPVVEENVENGNLFMIHNHG